MSRIPSWTSLCKALFSRKAIPYLAASILVGWTLTRRKSKKSAKKVRVKTVKETTLKERASTIVKLDTGLEPSKRSPENKKVGPIEVEEEDRTKEKKPKNVSKTTASAPTELSKFGKNLVKQIDGLEEMVKEVFFCCPHSNCKNRDLSFVTSSGERVPPDPSDGYAAAMHSLVVVKDAQGQIEFSISKEDDCSVAYSSKVLQAIYIHTGTENELGTLIIGVVGAQSKAGISKLYIVEADRLLSNSDYFKGMFQFGGLESAEGKFSLEFIDEMAEDIVLNPEFQKIWYSIPVFELFLQQIYRGSYYDAKLNTHFEQFFSGMDFFNQLIYELKLYLFAHRILAPDLMEGTILRAKQIILNGLVETNKCTGVNYDDTDQACNFFWDFTELLYSKLDITRNSPDGMKILFGIVYCELSSTAHHFPGFRKKGKPGKSPLDLIEENPEFCTYAVHARVDPLLAKCYEQEIRDSKELEHRLLENVRTDFRKGARS